MRTADRVMIRTIPVAFYGAAAFCLFASFILGFQGNIAIMFLLLIAGFATMGMGYLSGVILRETATLK